MSVTFTLSARSSVLSNNFNPPIYLEEDVEYEIGMSNFDTFNSIANVDSTNNLFVWGNNDDFKIEIPMGSYELQGIIDLLNQKIHANDPTANIIITPNKQTAKVTLTTNRKINFQVENSIGSLFGFDKQVLIADAIHHAHSQIKILKVNSICIDCNIAIGSYLNDKPVHIIHQFFPTVPIGFKIVESPLTILYFPVSVKTINNITVKVVDQNGQLINFQNEEITVRLHLRRKHY